MRVCVWFAVGLLGVVAPVSAQGRPGFVVQGATGTNLNGGGYSHAISAGVAATRYLEILVSAERNHIPTKVNYYVDGFGISRGGTTSFISGEARVSFLPSKRVTPFALAGLGRGTARPNVNEHFADEHSYRAALLFVGGGVRARVAGPVHAFAESRLVLQLDTSESGIYGFTPIRAGVALRF